MDDAIGLVLVYILISILVLLVIRELVCWYWKVNRAVSLLESIYRKLDRLPAREKEALKEEGRRRPYGLRRLPCRFRGRAFSRGRQGNNAEYRPVVLGHARAGAFAAYLAWRLFRPF